MNEVVYRKERAERKRPLLDINGASMHKLSSSPALETLVKRPSRACSSRRRLLHQSAAETAFVLSPTPQLPPTSLKASSGCASSFKRLSSRLSASRTGVRALSLTVATSVTKQRLELQSLWEMAAVNNFFCVFRHIINNLPEFTMDELECAILSPNSVLDTIHVVLLKGVPPAARVPLRGDTWPTVLSKKFKDWWWRVAEGPCPLVPCQGAELATYLELDATTRVRVLLALCEMRVDQDDARLYIDDLAKHSQFPAGLRKDKSGCGAEGTTFWLEEDPVMGQRLYREGQATMPVPPSKNKSRGWGRGRNVPPPVPGLWETVATSFEEFQEASSRLLESRNRLEVAMGKKLLHSFMPQMEKIQKRRDRMVKTRQREAMLLDNQLQGNGLSAGRSRRERKPVTYTFDEFDRSISEAIKFTKRNVLETPMRHGFVNGVHDVRGLGRERNDNAAYGQIGYVNEGGIMVRRSVRNFRLHPGSEYEADQIRDESMKPLLVEAYTGFSDDEIEGEAVYNDDYLAARQRKGLYSSWRGKSFDADREGENNCNEYGHNLNQLDERFRKQRRRCLKVRLVDDIFSDSGPRKERLVLNRMGKSDVEGSDLDEQIVRGAQRRLRTGKVVKAQRNAQGPSQTRRERVNGRFEEGSEEGSDSHGGFGYTFERRKGKRRRLSERNRKSGFASLRQDHVEFIDHCGDQLVHQSALSDEDENVLEIGSLDFDQEGSMGQEVEKKEDSGKRRQWLDLNEVATVARGNSPLSEYGLSESLVMLEHAFDAS